MNNLNYNPYPKVSDTKGSPPPPKGPLPFWGCLLVLACLLTAMISLLTGTLP